LHFFSGPLTYGLWVAQPVAQPALTLNDLSKIARQIPTRSARNRGNPVNHQSLRKQSVLKKGFAKIGNAIPKIVAEESSLETMWVQELRPETLTGEKNVYAQ